MIKDTWSFTVTSGAAIDFCEITKSLSYATPIATFDFDGATFAVIHNSLTLKALCAEGITGINKRVKEFIDIETPCDDGIVVKLVDDPDALSVILAWGEAVKGAPWQQQHRKRGEVTVTSHQV